MRPAIEVYEVKQKSAMVKVNDPQFFQRLRDFNAENIHLEESFEITYQADRKDGWRDQVPPAKTSDRIVPLTELTDDTKYRVICKMSCSSGDEVKGEKEFTTLKPSRKLTPISCIHFTYCVYTCMLQGRIYLWCCNTPL